MITFFTTRQKELIAVETTGKLSESDIEKLVWLFGDASPVRSQQIEGSYTGPRKEMITPWSTNAVEIALNMGVEGISRIELIKPAVGDDLDRMLEHLYIDPGQDLFSADRRAEPVINITDIAHYNEKEGLALSSDEIAYLDNLSKTLGRELTDSEVFGFSQVNSEHCRHKIFNGKFIIDGREMKESLFDMIKSTTRANNNRVVSAYRDNCALMQGPVAELFAPLRQDRPDFFSVRDYESVITLKAETHNFPTTVEPFNGAATGTGGEIRDRMAGGRGTFPVAGTAVYMTAYTRMEEGRMWERHTEPREWLYQTPEEILIKASNGASDYGNKFGQPLICGSVLTYEFFGGEKRYAYDKVIMLAGGIGHGKKSDSEKAPPLPGDMIVVMGGDNYRIGMGGSSVSSVGTGDFDSSIELNAVQRANPEMQKRVYNALRAMAESDDNPITSIHDHGAGGHLNSLSELVEDSGGIIDIDKLPVGDNTLSAKEIIGNESQERMGLVISEERYRILRDVAARERAPIYAVGKVTGDRRFTLKSEKSGEKPVDLELRYLFGDPPKTVIRDSSRSDTPPPLPGNSTDISGYLSHLLQLEEVACKDWLTNKVDRSVTGRVAGQQCVGELQLPLNNTGVIALDYRGTSGIATAIGHAPGAGLVDPEAGSVLSIAEALTNIVWAPLKYGLKGVSLSANWMWPCKNSGEDARLYSAVKAAAGFATALGINIPTGKDSLSMTQKYGKESVLSPGTVIISAAAEVDNVRGIIEPVMVNDRSKPIFIVDMSFMPPVTGGSSFSQLAGTPGSEVPVVSDPGRFALCFATIQEMIRRGMVVAGHDISAGGLITTLLELCFANRDGGMALNLTPMGVEDCATLLFSQNPGVVIQVEDEDAAVEFLLERGVSFLHAGHPVKERKLFVTNGEKRYEFDIDDCRTRWMKTSYLFDIRQSGEYLALERYRKAGEGAISYSLGEFNGTAAHHGIERERRTASGVRAAIIREKGVNGDREMAYALWLAGFDVKDVHMTDLISGREDLEDISMIVFVGGFSNSDVLGSAKGWAGAFRYNEKARLALDRFYDRGDTLSLGVCNGCQLMAELGLIYPEHSERPLLKHNMSGKFESSFLGVKIEESTAVMLRGLEGMELGIWVAHGEGRFHLPLSEGDYSIPVKYSRSHYPANPNGSPFDAAALCSSDGRHLAIMPHLERSFMPWQCAYYPHERRGDEITPWMATFRNAFSWCREMQGR